MDSTFSGSEAGNVKNSSARGVSLNSFIIR